MEFPKKITGVGSLSLSKGSSWPRNWIWVSCIAGGFFTDWDICTAPYSGFFLQIIEHLLCGTVSRNIEYYIRLKLSSGHRTGKGQFSNPKEGQCQRMFKLLNDCTHLTLQQSKNKNSRSQAWTVHEPWTSRNSSWSLKRQRKKRSNCQRQSDHRKSKRVPENIYFCFIDYTKTFDSVDHNNQCKILQEMGIPDHRPPDLSAEKSVWRSRCNS